MTSLETRWIALRQRIHAACSEAGRNPESLRLLAVSKTRSIDEILAVHALGQDSFGENYVQEFVAKHDALTEPALDLGIEWHYIGALQTNKTRPIAERAHWIHSLDRLKIAQRLSGQRPATLPPLQVCLQVDLSHEPAKAGVPETGLLGLADSVSSLPGLHLRGLMTLPAPSDDPVEQRRPFARLRELRDELNQRGHDLDTLSMGMSDDLEAAIVEGATLVRIGTALFGPRTTRE